MSTKKATATYEESQSENQTAAEATTTEAKTETAAEAGGEKNASGFYIYLGPTLKGLIQQNAICRGDRAKAYETWSAAIEADKLVKTLIIPGDGLPEARVRLKKHGTALYSAFRRLKSS